MKKLLSILLIFAMCTSTLAAFAGDMPVSEKITNDDEMLTNDNNNIEETQPESEDIIDNLG